MNTQKPRQIQIYTMMIYHLITLTIIPCQILVRQLMIKHPLIRKVWLITLPQTSSIKINQSYRKGLNKLWIYRKRILQIIKMNLRIKINENQLRPKETPSQIFNRQIKLLSVKNEIVSYLHSFCLIQIRLNKLLNLKKISRTHLQRQLIQLKRDLKLQRVPGPTRDILKILVNQRERVGRIGPRLVVTWLSPDLWMEVVVVPLMRMKSSRKLLLTK